MNSSFSILFVPFDATTKWVALSSKKGVKGLVDDKKGLEFETEAPGVPMTKYEIMKEMNQIISFLVEKVWAFKAYNKNAVPELIFLSEEVGVSEKMADELKLPAAERKKVATFPEEIKFTLMKDMERDRDIRYKKLPNTAASIQVQIIAAYELVENVPWKKKARIEAGFEMKSLEVIWKDPNFDEQQHVLKVMCTPAGSSKSLTIAGVHLTSKNTSSNFKKPEREAAVKHIKEMCKKDNVQLVIGDFNFDVHGANEMKDDNIEAWRGSTREWDVMIPDSKGVVDTVNTVVTKSNTNNKKHYMGIIKVAAGIDLEHATSLPRSLEGKVRRYFSDHSPIYATLAWKE